MSTVITNTIVEIPNTDKVSNLPGDVSPETIKDTFSGFFPIINTCVYTTKVVGDTKYITFSEKLGTKGNS